MRSTKWMMRITLFFAATFFILPLISAGIFSLRGFGGIGLTLENYHWLIQQPYFLKVTITSVKIALVSSGIVLLVVVPTVIHLHRNGRKYRKFVEVVSLIPVLIPVVAIAVGAQFSMPNWLRSSYFELSFLNVVVALPIVFRTLDNDLRSIPLTTLFESSQTLGANWLETVRYVIFPAIRSSVSTSILITFIFSFGEYSLAVLLHFQTLPTWAVSVSQQNFLGSVAFAIGALLIGWLAVLVMAFAPKVMKQISLRLEGGR